MKTETFNRILLVIIGALIALIFCGTIIGLARKKTQTPQLLVSKGKAINLAAPANTEIIEYYDLSTIRIVTNPDKNKKDDFGSAMVISPWLAYPKGDTVFFEEIARKQGALKAVFTQYFAEKTQAEILSLGEAKITSDLLAKLNALLSLGKISDIFFTDFIFL
ncbi:MAG: hypothetical protein K5866_01720 [Treponema sp.]|nr:hypothetical protein [Treponema sp.]